MINNQRSLQRLEGLMTQWLAYDSMAQQYKQRLSLQSKISTLTRRVDDAMVGYYNEKMIEKATMKIGR